MVLLKSALTPLAVLSLPVVLLKSALESAGSVEVARGVVNSALLRWRCCCRPWCC